MKTIGIIGGVTWHSSIEYYRLINQGIAEILGGQNSAKIVLYSVNFSEHLDIHQTEGWDGVLNETVEIGQKLKRAGADFLILAANTLHRIAGELENVILLPVLHITETTGEAIIKTGLKKIGLIGTRYTMGEDFYKKRLKEDYGLEIVIPDEEDFKKMDDMIYNDLACGNYGLPTQKRCKKIINNMEKKGVEGIILGCTELPKLIKSLSLSLPVFDTLAIHAKAAVKFALKVRQKTLGKKSYFDK